MKTDRKTKMIDTGFGMFFGTMMQLFATHSHRLGVGSATLIFFGVPMIVIGRLELHHDPVDWVSFLSGGMCSVPLAHRFVK